MKKFEFSSPGTLSEALEQLEKYGARAKVIAGGTDLIVQMTNGRIAPERVINLLKIPELAGIRENGQELRIGALTKLSILENSPIIQVKWSLLSAVAHKAGPPQIRNAGTLGGNICNASPAGDTALPLLIYEAAAVLASNRGERIIPLDSFFRSPGLTVLEATEILKEIIIPQAPADSTWAYLKLGRRKSLDIAQVSVAVLLSLHPKTKVCQKARVAMGAVAPTPIRTTGAEEFLEEKTLDDRVIREAGEIAKKECSPISDMRARAEYRKEMVGVLVQRAIKKSLGFPIPPTGI